MNRLTLGQTTEYPQEYAPEVLFPIARADARARLGLAAAVPFAGCDVWNAWELSWLDDSGRPQIAAATMTIGADSPNVVESKSLKLYLGAFAMSRFASAAKLQQIIAADLSRVAGAPVTVSLSAGTGGKLARIVELPGSCVDTAAFTAPGNRVDAGLLRCAGDEIVTETLYSQLLRSLCPVTAQPDYGSVLLRYRGRRIEPSAFLEYVVSFRRHDDFHEACVERMFVDISDRCAPDKLTVYARYSRRGGIDINPFRSNFEHAPENLRTWRQ